MTEKRKAMLQIAGIVAAFVLLVVGTIFYKSLIIINYTIHFSDGRSFYRYGEFSIDN